MPSDCFCNVNASGEVFIHGRITRSGAATLCLESSTQNTSGTTALLYFVTGHILMRDIASYSANIQPHAHHEALHNATKTRHAATPVDWHNNKRPTNTYEDDDEGTAAATFIHTSFSSSEMLGPVSTYSFASSVLQGWLKCSGAVLGSFTAASSSLYRSHT